MASISELASRHHLSRSTLLHYDRIGLLRPGGRNRNAYRVYTSEDAERLEQICTFRRVGLSLADIRKLLDAPGHAMAPMLQRRLADLDAEMGRLRGQQRLIAQLLRDPALLEGLAVMDKATWVGLLRASGFSEKDMERWHMAFEAADPERHQSFLSFLGLSPEEVAAIRAWSTGSGD